MPQSCYIWLTRKCANINMWNVSMSRVHQNKITLISSSITDILYKYFSFKPLKSQKNLNCDVWYIWNSMCTDAKSNYTCIHTHIYTFYIYKYICVCVCVCVCDVWMTYCWKLGYHWQNNKWHAAQDTFHNRRHCAGLQSINTNLSKKLFRQTAATLQWNLITCCLISTCKILTAITQI